MDGCNKKLNVKGYNQAKEGIARCVHPFILHRLPRVLVRNLDRQYKIIFKDVSSKTSSLYKSHKLTKKYRTVLVDLGALTHGNFNSEAISNATLSRRKAYVDNHIDRVQTITSDIVSVAGNLAFKYLQNANRNHKIFDQIDNFMLKQHIRDYNLILREWDKDLGNSIHRTLQCILHGWSVNSLKAFRYSV